MKIVASFEGSPRPALEMGQISLMKLGAMLLNAGDDLEETPRNNWRHLAGARLKCGCFL